MSPDWGTGFGFEGGNILIRIPLGIGQIQWKRNEHGLTKALSAHLPEHRAHASF